MAPSVIYCAKYAGGIWGRMSLCMKSRHACAGSGRKLGKRARVPSRSGHEKAVGGGGGGRSNVEYRSVILSTEDCSVRSSYQQSGREEV